MRLSCELEVMNRLLPSLSHRGKRRSSHAIIAVGCQLKERRCAVAVYTAQSRSATIYEVENLCEMFTKFAAEGKATLRFREPPHDLCIKSDPLELKTFLQALKSMKEGKEEKKLSPMQPPSSSQLKRLQTKLIITQRKDYPLTTSFPSSLRILQITDCGLLRIDSRILAMKQLQSLILSHNTICDVPPALGGMSTLKELHINGNNLRTLPAELFSVGMFPALAYFDLSDNHLTSLPSGLSTLSKLHTLKLDGNGLEQLPSNIGDLSQLRLLTLSRNALQFLPGSITGLRLDSIDVFGNPLQERLQPVLPVVLELAIPTLQELSAQTILKHKLQVRDGDIPRCLVDYLKTGTKCLLCSSVAFKSAIEATCMFNLREIAHTITSVSSQGGLDVKVPVRLQLCSPKCCVFNVRVKTQQR